MKKLLILILISVFISCQQQTEQKPDVEKSKLGEVFLEVTGDEKAKEVFTKGLLLLHSFEYEDARAQFLKAQELDPKLAMAYWGEAMTFNHSLWQAQEQDSAKAALKKLAGTPAERNALFISPLEKHLHESVEILFGEGTKYDRDLAYKDFMKDLTETYPDNHEVSAFYAIALLGSARNGRDEDLYGRSAQIAQSILKENPEHPGALHYLIHSYDDPGHAHMALSAADSYSKVAPDAAHALHMPSHIYVALGKWKEVVQSNIASWNASMKKVENEKAETGSYHALNWLQYGLLQRGEFEMAENLLNAMERYCEENPTKVARSYLVAMKGAHLVETNNFQDEIADIAIDVKDLNLVKKAGNAYVEGMTAFHKNQPVKLKEIIEKLSKEKYTASLNLGDSKFAMCSVGGFATKPPNQLDIDMTSVIELQLEAALLELQGEKVMAISKLKKASELDNGLTYSYGPPAILKPAQEAYAEALMEHELFDLAESAYEEALKKNPRRLLSLKGKKKVLEKLNKFENLAALQGEIDQSIEEKTWDAIKS